MHLMRLSTTDLGHYFSAVHPGQTHSLLCYLLNIGLSNYRAGYTGAYSFHMLSLYLMCIHSPVAFGSQGL